MKKEAEGEEAEEGWRLKKAEGGWRRGGQRRLEAGRLEERRPKKAGG